ncbi:MAG: SGNH/GDSL hydrolase family protein [Candidatus Competibacterales bacterium]
MKAPIIRDVWNNPWITHRPRRAATTVGLWVVLTSFVSWAVWSSSSSAQSQGLAIQAVGDSYFDWNQDEGNDIPTLLGAGLDAAMVQNNAIGGTLVTDSGFDGRLSIPQQYQPGVWDWVVMSGGGNDVQVLCDCSACDQVLDNLISVDGSRGLIPAFADRVRADGARLLIMGYPFLDPNTDSDFINCNDELTELHKRQARMARRRGDVVFASARTVINPEDHRLFAEDLLHPSPAGGALIAAMLQRHIEEMAILAPGP